MTPREHQKAAGAGAPLKQTPVSPPTQPPFEPAVGHVIDGSESREVGNQWSAPPRALNQTNWVCCPHCGHELAVSTTHSTSRLVDLHALERAL